MSDSSSDEEDLSKFREAVDNSFVKTPNTSIEQSSLQGQKSERYLQESGHYNDVQVPPEMQKKIGAKISAIIQKNIEFVEVNSAVKKRKVKGGVKLFQNSKSFLSCEEEKDTYTANHNMEAKKLKNNRKQKDDTVTDDEKVCLAAVTGDYILSKEDTKAWKSRRKEKLFKYKSNGKSKVLTAVDEQ